MPINAVREAVLGRKAEVGQLPDEVRRIAQELREVFGPSVRLLRVTGSTDLGNPKWDQLCEESDREN